MDTTTPPPARAPARSKHRLTWFVVFLGLLEIAAIVAFIEVKGFASTVCSATVAAQQQLGTAPSPLAAGSGGAAGGGAMQGASGGLPDDGGDANAVAPAPVAATAVPQAIAFAPAGNTSAAKSGDAHVQGDTSQIVDPKCVGNAADAALSSSPSAAAPTCGPMQQPAALKQAETQISK